MTQFERSADSPAKRSQLVEVVVASRIGIELQGAEDLGDASKSLFSCGIGEGQLPPAPVFLRLNPRRAFNFFVNVNNSCHNTPLPVQTTTWGLFQIIIRLFTSGKLFVQRLMTGKEA